MASPHGKEYPIVRAQPGVFGDNGPLCVHAGRTRGYGNVLPNNRVSCTDLPLHRVVSDIAWRDHRGKPLNWNTHGVLDTWTRPERLKLAAKGEASGVMIEPIIMALAGCPVYGPRSALQGKVP